MVVSTLYFYRQLLVFLYITIILGYILTVITTYTPICARVLKIYKIKYFNRPRNEPLILIGYWSNNIEEYFHIYKPDNNNKSEKYITHNMKNTMNTMVKHVGSMEQGMVGLQEKFIEWENERINQ